MDFITIGNTADGWLKVKFVAATENCFEINPKLKGHEETLKKICLMLPRMVKLDGDLMEAYDGADVKISDVDITLVKKFASTFEFRNVECALPGFDRM